MLKRSSRQFALPTLLAVGAGALVVGLSAGAVAGAGGVAALVWMRDGGVATGLPDGRSAAEGLDDELERLREFVAATRELDFTRPVDVRVLGEAEFQRAFEDAPEMGPPSPDDLPATLAALGLTRSPAAVEQWLGDASVDGVDGFFDPSTETVYVKGSDWTPRVELVVVHELVHALQHQHFDLEATSQALRGDDESWMAFLSTVEGDASWVEEEYIATQARAWSDELYQSYEAEMPLAVTEPFLAAMTALPYDLGWTFAFELQAIGGNEAVNRALRQPPTTLEQVWSPDAWFDGEDAVTAGIDVPAPAAPDGVRVLGEGTLGAHLLAMLGLEDDEMWLLEHGPLEGWRGDRYVTWSQDGGAVPCTAVDVHLDSAQDVEDAVERLENWVADGGEVTASSESVLSLSRCD